MVTPVGIVTGNNGAVKALFNNLADNKQSQRNPLRASGGKDGIADIGKNIDKTLYKVCLYVDKRFSSRTSPVYHLAGQEQHGKILSSTDKWHGFC